MPDNSQQVRDPNKLCISEIDVRVKHNYRKYKKGNQTFEEMIEFCEFVDRDPRMYNKTHLEYHLENGLFESYLKTKEVFGSMKLFWEFVSNPDWRSLDLSRYSFLHFELKE